MAKKNVQVIYTVTDAGLIKAEKSLKANEEAAKKADAAVKKYGEDAKKAGDGASKSFLNLGTVWKGLVAIGITAFFVNLAKKTFELGVKQEQLNIAFTTFLGSAEKAKKLLQDLTKFAIVTPFTPDQVNNAAKALLAFGVAGRDIIPTLKMLGDVSSGTGKDLTEMAIIFGQIRSTGRLMGQDLLQLINAGFNPLQIISEQTGKSVGRLKTEMEKGLITFDMVSDAFKSATSEGGRFFNLMEKQSQSIGGLLSTVSGNLDEVLKNIFTANTGLVAEFTAVLVKASEGLLQFSLTAEQARDRVNSSIQESLKKSLEDLAKEMGVDMPAAIVAMDKAINESIDLYEQQLIAVQKSADATEEEQREILLNLNTKRNQLKGLQDYVAAQKEANEAEESKRLAAQLEKELALKEKLAKIKKIAEPSTNVDVSRLDDEAAAIVKSREEQAKALDEIAKESLKRLSDDKLFELEKFNETELLKTKVLEEEEKKRRELRQKAFDYGLDLLEQLLMASINANDQTFEREKGNFDQRLTNAGDNARARMEIEAERDKFEREQDLKAEQFAKEKAKRDKDRQVKQMIIQNVLNAIRALGTPPVPNFPLAAITGGFGLAQIALAKGLGFKDGVINLQGPGTTTSDSIPARLSRGESVINAESTSRSLELLEAVNDGRIDDRFLKSLKLGSGGVTVLKDNSDVVDAIERSKTDYSRQGHFVYETIQRGKNLKRHTISKYRNS